MSNCRQYVTPNSKEDLLSCIPSAAYSHLPDVSLIQNYSCSSFNYIPNLIISNLNHKSGKVFGLKKYLTQ